jgi:metal-sulfur cluster biosynthetic enzyme
VRAAGLDGVEGRDRQGPGGGTMTENTTTQDTVAQDTGAQETGPEAAGEFTGELITELTPEQEDVLEALRDVVDPELGINVVDLGLVYGVDVDAERVATIDMTLTSAACPLTDVIEDQAREALEGIVTDFRINWVWMPPWGPESITDDGREQLRALGFNI